LFTQALLLIISLKSSKGLTLLKYYPSNKTTPKALLKVNEPAEVLQNPIKKARNPCHEFKWNPNGIPDTGLSLALQHQLLR